MRTVTSLPTIEQSNVGKLLEQIRVLDPELFQFQLIRLETGISPVLATKLFREIQNIVIGGGYGKVSVWVQDGVIKDLTGERRHKIEEKINLEDGIYVTSEFVSITEIREK